MTITLSALRYFRLVADAGNVSRAANQLNVGQSAVSRQIQALEQALGTPLLFRHRRGVELTLPGAHVLDRCKVILGMIGDLHREVAAIDPKPEGVLRVGYPASLGSMLIAPVIGAIAREFPAIEISLFEGFSAEVAARVEREDLDIGIVSLPDPNPNIRLTPLFSEEVCVVGQRDDWTLTDEVDPDEIAGRPLMVTKAVGHAVSRLLRQAGHEPGRVIEISSQSTLVPLLRQQMGWLVVPRSAVHAEIRAGDLCLATLKGMRMDRYLVRRRFGAPAPTVTVFADELGKRISGLSETGQLVPRTAH